MTKEETIQSPRSSTRNEDPKTTVATDPGTHGTSSKAAFTLIEVIATITLSAILIALLLPILGSALTNNTRQVEQLQEAYELRTYMDDWLYQYRATNYGNDLRSLKEAIEWEATHRELFNAEAVWVNFDLTTGNEIVTDDEDDLLRITLSNDQGNRLTYIFSKRDPAPIPPPEEL